MKSERIPMTFVACMILAACAAPAVAYHVSYEYFVYATNSDDTFTDIVILLGQTHAEGDYTSSTAMGNWGTAAFVVDLASATLSATAHSHGLPEDHTWGANGRVEYLEFRDELFYTVPAGYYENGVQVGLTARAFGTITSEVGAGAEAVCYIETGYVVYNSGLVTVGIDESGTDQIDADIILTYYLVWPGTTLLATTVFEEHVTARIARGRAWSVGYNPGGGYVTGDADVDFTDGLRILSIDAPPGVTWSSGSGVLLAPVAAVGDGPAAPQPHLHQNHPNPFNPSTSIAFDLPAASRVDLRIYDIAGHLVRTLFSGETLPAGRREAVWRGRDETGAPVATGVYFYRLDTPGHVETKSMILLK